MAFTVLVDWNRDGDYSDTSEDVTSLVRGQSSFEYGRDQSTALAPTVAGRGSLTLDNRDKRFSPRNTASPIYGKIKPARPVKITRSLAGSTYFDVYSDLYGSGDATYTLFVGHTDDSPINPDVENKTVSLSLVDGLADMRGVNISTPLYRGIRTGEAIGYILDAAGWSGSMRILNPGATVIPWWWEENTDALTALENVLRSEGTPAMLTMSSDGHIVFKDRHHRLTDTASLTSQATWRATGTVEPVMTRPGFSYDEAWRNIINTGSIQVNLRKPALLDRVWETEDTFTFTAGEVKKIVASGSDPFFNAVTPVSGTDFITKSGTVTATLSRTSGASTTIILTATGTAEIQGLALRAVSVPVVRSVQVEISDGSSISDYGPRSFPHDLPWCNPDDAEAVLNTAIALRAQPVPIIQAKFVLHVSNIVRIDNVLSRDLSDRLTIIEPETSTNGDFYVETIAHEFTSEFDHLVTVGVEAVPATNPLVQFRFDTTGAGFNDGSFYTGVDNPATMFRFDSSTSGHRFNDGFFAQ